MVRVAAASLAALLAAAATASPARCAVDCPSTAQRHGLIAFSVLEQAEATLTDYAPDTSRRGAAGTYKNSWRLAPAAQLIAVCRYGGGVEQRIRIPAGLRQCQSEGMPDQLRARCE